MKYNKLFLGVILLGLGSSHCGGDDSASSNGGAPSDSSDVVDNTTVDYKFSGTVFLIKEKTVTNDQTLTVSEAILSFNNLSGTATVQPSSTFKNVCVRSDAATDTTTDVPEPTTTPPSNTQTISAGTATVKDGQSSQVATIVPTTSVVGVIYPPNNDILAHNLLNYGSSYTVTLAGATNADPAVVVPSFSVPLFIANPGTVSIGSQSVDNLVINDAAVSLEDVKNSFTWSSMGTVKSPDQSGSNFGIQYVRFIDADDESKSVACVLAPDQTNLQAALSASASNVFDILADSNAFDILLAQVNTVYATPKTSDSDQGFVPAYAETVQVFSSVTLNP